MTETIKYALTLSGSAYTQFEKALSDEIGSKRKGRKGSSTKVMWCKAAEIEWMLETAAREDGDKQILQICTNSESAEVKISDKDCFFKAGITYEGIALQMRQIVMRYIIDRPYIKKTMWIGIDSVGIAEATAVIHLSLDFTYKYLNDWILQRMIAAKI